MDSPHWPLILIEGVLVFGGALAFGWWQLRSVKRDRERLAEQRRLEAAQREVPVGEQPESQGQEHSSR